MIPLRRGAPALLAGLLLAAWPGPGRPADHDTPRPRNVILMISDGMGPAAAGLARLLAGRPLTLDSLLVGACGTAATDARVTDSAAAATALASGLKTKNAFIGLDPAGQPVATLLEGAQAGGRSTGLVATSRITHATPAAFAAHELDRGSEEDIARQMIEHRVDLLLGGGRRFFQPAPAGGARADRRDLLAEARAAGATIVDTPAALSSLDRLPAIGLFTPDHMSYEIDRDPSKEPALAEMAGRSIALLNRDPDGFFLMVEGSRIDHASHENDPGAMARDVLAYDAAVRVARDFARREGNTLVVSVSDHETGGLSLGRRRDERSYSDVNVEALVGCRASCGRMVGEIRAGASPESALAREAGLDSLGEPDRRLLADGVAGSDGRLVRALGEVESRRALVGWATTGHTALDVDLYAEGPGAGEFRGRHENSDVGQIIARLLGVDLAEATTRLRTTGAKPPSPAAAPR